MPLCVYTHRFSERQHVGEVERIDSFAALQLFLEDLTTLEKRSEKIQLTTRGEMTRIMALMNGAGSDARSLFPLYSKQSGWQTFDFVPSNLGIGYLAYFICQRCERRVRYLYRPEPTEPYYCRICYRIIYRTKRK